MATTPTPLTTYGNRRRFDDYSNPGATVKPYSFSQYNSSEPGKMSEQDRQFAYDQGGAIDVDLQARGDTQAADEDYFKRRGLELYGDLEETPGYTAEETGAIQGQEGLEGLKYTPGMAQDLQLTDAEKEGIAGDPNRPLNYYDPAATSDIANNTSAYARGEHRQGADNVRGVGDAASAAQRGVIDANGLTFDPTTGEQIQGAVDRTASNVRGAIDPTKLSVSQSYLDKYPMTDAQKEALVSKSTRQVGTQYRGLQDDIELRAAASGNASPAAVAAMKARLANDESINMADARSDAEVAADAAQRATVQGAETTRLGAEQNYAGLKSGSELSLGDQATAAALSTEKTRLDAAARLQGYQSAAEKDVADQQIAIELEQQKRGTATEFEAGAQEQAANLANQKTGIEATRAAEEAVAARAAATAANRQGNVQFAQQQGYQQNRGVNDAETARATQVADARRAGQQETRGYATGQQAQASNNVNTAAGQRIDAYGTTAGAANTATHNKQAYELGKSGQGWGAVAKNIVASTVSNLTKPRP